MLGAEGGSLQVKVLDCSEFCVTARGDDWDRARSISLTNVEITFDDREKRLKLQECYT